VGAENRDHHLLGEVVTVAEVSANLCRDCVKGLQKRHDWLLALVSGLRA